MRLKAIKFAEILNDAGIQSEDNVTIICSHNDDLVSVIIGVSAIGAIINPLDTSFTTNEIQHFLQMTKPKLIICDENVHKKVEASLLTIGQESKIFVLGESETNESIDNLLIGFESTTFVPKEISDLNKTALVMCSSGTTGVPKGVVISHLMATNSIRMWWSVNVESTTPLTPNVILNVLIQHKVNVVFLSPSIVMGLLTLLEESNGKMSLSSLRLLVTGGSFVSDELIKSMSRFLPEGKMFSCYGMTEVGGMIASNEMLHKKETFKEDAVTQLIEENFSDSKRLRGGVFFVKALPMTTTGKIHRKLVKEMILKLNKN